jgi:hypothetical protein
MKSIAEPKQRILIGELKTFTMSLSTEKPRFSSPIRNCSTTPSSVETLNGVEILRRCIHRHCRSERPFTLHPLEPWGRRAEFPFSTRRARTTQQLSHREVELRSAFKYIRGLSIYKFQAQINSSPPSPASQSLSSSHLTFTLP